MRYHINPKTGQISECRAKERCPFGEENHRDTLEEAQLYADEINEKIAKEIEKWSAPPDADIMFDSLKTTDSRNRFKVMGCFDPEKVVDYYKTGIILNYDCTRDMALRRMKELEMFGMENEMDVVLKPLRQKLLYGEIKPPEIVQKELDKIQAQRIEDWRSSIDNMLANMNEQNFLQYYADMYSRMRGKTPPPPLARNETLDGFEYTYYGENGVTGEYVPTDHPDDEPDLFHIKRDGEIIKTFEVEFNWPWKVRERKGV